MFKKLISLISIVVITIGTLVGCSSNNTQQSSIDMSDVDTSDMSWYCSELTSRVKDQYNLDYSMYIDYDESTNFVMIHIPMDGEYLSEDDVYFYREVILADKKNIGSRMVEIFNNTLLACNDSGVYCNVMLELTDDGFAEHGPIFVLYCNHTLSLHDIQNRQEDVYNKGSIMID